jgi:hypothetical protein
VDGSAILFVKLRMINGRGNVELVGQVSLHFERVLDRRGIDDARSFERVVSGKERRKNAQLVGFFIGDRKSVV